jgi:hypothetical protein
MSAMWSCKRGAKLWLTRAPVVSRSIGSFSLVVCGQNFVMTWRGEWVEWPTLTCCQPSEWPQHQQQLVQLSLAATNLNDLRSMWRSRNCGPLICCYHLQLVGHWGKQLCSTAANTLISLIYRTLLSRIFSENSKAPLHEIHVLWSCLKTTRFRDHSNVRTHEA